MAPFLPSRESSFTRATQGSLQPTKTALRGELQSRIAGSAAHPVSSGSATTTPAQSAVRDQSLVIERSSPRSGRTRTAPLQRRAADGRCGGKQSDDKDVAPSAQRRKSKRRRGRRSHGKERGKSASGSAQRLRTLKERSGKECDLRKSRSFSERSRSSPEGPRLQAWCAQRIERVARRAAPRCSAKSCKIRRYVDHRFSTRRWVDRRSRSKSL